MKPPTKFQIMRINRGYIDFVNHKQEIVEKIDCCELEVLRTLREREEQEEYAAANRVAQAMQKAVGDASTLPLPAPQEVVEFEPPPRPAIRFFGGLWRRA